MHYHCEVLTISLFSEPKRISSDIKVDDDKLSKMLDTIMGEANEIRGGRPKSTSSSGSS